MVVRVKPHLLSIEYRFEHSNYRTLSHDEQKELKEFFAYMLLKLEYHACNIFAIFSKIHYLIFLTIFWVIWYSIHLELACASFLMKKWILLKIILLVRDSSMEFIAIVPWTLTESRESPRNRQLRILTAAILVYAPIYPWNRRSRLGSAYDTKHLQGQHDCPFTAVSIAACWAGDELWEILPSIFIILSTKVLRQIGIRILRSMREFN